MNNEKVEAIREKYAAGIPAGVIEDAADKMIEKAEKTMTVKELASVAGVSCQTVRRSASNIGLKTVNGITSRYTKTESEKIMEDIRKRGFVTPSQNGKVQDYQTSVAIQSIAASLKALTAMMSSLNNRMSVVECNQKALPLPLDYYTVLAYCKNKGFAPTTGEAVSIGLSCKKMSALRGLEVKKIPDARYGTVNAYHISVLKDVVEL